MRASAGAGAGTRARDSAGGSARARASAGARAGTRAGDSAGGSARASARTRTRTRYVEKTKQKDVYMHHPIVHSRLKFLVWQSF